MEPVPISRAADGAGRSWNRLLCDEGSLVLWRRDLLLKRKRRRSLITLKMSILGVSKAAMA